MRQLLFIFLLFPFFTNAQVITTYAGNGIAGDVLGNGGPAINAEIASPYGLNLDDTGNLLIGQVDMVRKVNTVTNIITTIAGSDTASSLGHGGDGGPAIAALMLEPWDICVDNENNYYIADRWYSEVRKVNIATGIIDTFAGNRLVGSIGDGGPAKNAELDDPIGVCFDKAQQYLYIADEYGHNVRRVDMLTGIIGTYAGIAGVSGYSGDGGPATEAHFSRLLSIRIDSAGNLYIGDWDNARIRKVDASTGVVTTFAGNGTVGYSGDGGLATAAMINAPAGITLDKCGNLYFTDQYNQRVRRIDVNTSIITTVAGNGIAGFSGDSGLAVNAELNYPTGLAIDSSGNLYITDFTNNRVRKVTIYNPQIIITAIPGDTVCNGTPVTFQSVVTGGGTVPSYQWFLDGSAVSGATISSYTYTPANGDSISCILASNSACVGTPLATSNTVYMVVTSGTITVPSVSITSVPSDTVCVGTSVTVTATATGGGTAPVYQWIKNGVTAGSGATYSYIPANGDSIRCVLTGSNPCTVPTSVSSNSIFMDVLPVTSSSVHISVSPSDTVCAGTSVTVTAIDTGGGTSSIYQWIKNGVAVGSGATYSYFPANGDSVRCVLTSSNPCTVPVSISSNTIIMDVLPVVTPSLHIVASPSDTLCGSGIVSFTATATGGGSMPAYQWLLDGSAAGTGGSTFSYTATGNDSVRCVLNSNASCASPAVTGSNTIAIVVDSFVTPSISLSGPLGAFPGTTVTVTATVANAGSGYLIRWYNDGALFSTTTVPSVTYVEVSGGNEITAEVVQQSFHCNDSALSDTLDMFALQGVGVVAVPYFSLYPNPAHDAITITGSDLHDVRISNAIGQLLLSSNINADKVTIDISMLPAGVYFLKVNGVAVKKFIKE